MWTSVGSVRLSVAGTDTGPAVNWAGFLAVLQVHCYRMLGSAQDAENAMQETLLAAWQGLGGFEGRASVRTWLYRIVTTRCLNARRSASRRLPAAGDLAAGTQATGAHPAG
jgi:DNA-directed RNA polymerase specialized sigma24 family protein